MTKHDTFKTARGIQAHLPGPTLSAILSVAFVVTASPVGAFTFDAVDIEDAQAIETFLETAPTDRQNPLPSGQGSMVIVETRTDPEICREFVVNLEGVGQQAAVGCRVGSGSWALTENGAQIDGDPLLVPPPGPRPEQADSRPTPARLLDVPTIYIPDMSLAALPPETTPPEPGSPAPSAADQVSESDAGPSSDAAIVTPPDALPIVALLPPTRPEGTGPDETDPNQENPVPGSLSAFPSPSAKPNRPSGAAPEIASIEAPPISGRRPALAPDIQPLERPDFDPRSPDPRPVPDRLAGFPQPQTKPNS